MNLKSIVHQKTKTVKVSIIVPVYNVEEYLEETIESLVSQTLDNIEIIFVDDGSSDKSPDIIANYSRLYSNIVFLKQKNEGPGIARNKGLEIAKGDYISFVDSDDILPLDAIETMYNTALLEEADIILGASQSFNSKETWFIGSHLNNRVYEEGEKSLISNPELLYSLGPCNKLYKSSVLKNIRFPGNIHVTEDQPFVIEAYLKANKIYTVNKIIYKYRSRETETNPSLSQIVRVNSVKVLKDIFKSLSLSDLLWDKYITNKSARYELKRYYYNRIISADIWPAIRNAIESKNEAMQTNTFKLVLSWVEAIGYKLFNDLPILHRVMTYETASRFKNLTQKARKLYIDWLVVCFSLLDPGALHALETSKKQEIIRVIKKAWKRRSTYPLNIHFAKLKFKKLQSMIKTAIVRRVIYNATKLLPIQKKITFATNKTSKLEDTFEYIYNELIEQRPNYKIIGHFKKKRTFKDFAKLYYDIATSRYVILDDYYRHLYKLKVRKGTDVIQTWHACGAFKKFGHSAVGFKDSNTTEFENQAHGFYTKAVVTCKEIVPFYAEAFGLPENSIYPIGLARTDLFFNKDSIEYQRLKYLKQYPQIQGKRILTYAPTFRGKPGKRATFSIELDLEQMSKELSDEYVLVLKLHPSVTKAIKIPDEVKDFVLDLSKHNINNVLAITDILISDYSSLIFEYSLLERPMIFFAYDLDDYLEERGFYYDYKDFVPGPITVSTEEVIKVIKKNNFDLQRIHQFNNRFFDDLDGQSAKRFVEILIEP